MKKLPLLFLFIILIYEASISQQLDKTWAIKAREFIQKYYNLDFEFCFKQFDESVQKSFSIDMFKQAYSQTEFRYGKLLEIGETEAFDAKGYHITGTQVKHEKGSYTIEITYGGNGKIYGFYFKPPKPSKTKEPKSPEYVNQEKFITQDIEFGSKFKLKGKLTIPKEGSNFPVLILVHGSGPNDMDETIGPNKPFRDLAEGLSSLGIAVLRYNKRTNQYGALIAQNDTNFTLVDEVVDDVEEAFNFLQTESKINKDKIFVLGHSLGGYSIPLIAERLMKGAGFIIFAGSNQPLEDKLVDQYEYISKLENNQGINEDILNQVRQLRNKIKNRDYNDQTPRDSLLMGISPGYWNFLSDYRPLIIIKNINKPILVLQGARDYQVTVAEFELWKKALEKNPQAKFELYDNLNHLFMAGKGMAVPEEYMKEGFVAEKVIKDIGLWIKSH